MTIFDWLKIRYDYYLREKKNYSAPKVYRFSITKVMLFYIKLLAHIFGSDSLI